MLKKSMNLNKKVKEREVFSNSIFHIWSPISEVMKKYKFQLNISKMMPAKQKNTGTWGVNITIVEVYFATARSSRTWL